MAAPADQIERAMPFTSRYPDLGTGPVDVRPMIDPELFELERERIFRQVWLYVARAEELAEPGDYKLRRLDVANTSIIIVRDKSGEVHAFHNICTHRGNMLIPEQGAQSLGHTATHTLTCRFHAWTFNTDGSLRGVARQESFADLDKSCLGLKRVHCAEWEGFIFINLAEQPRRSLVDYLDGMAQHFAGYPYHEATLRLRYSAVLNCNWKVALYAFSEAYHVPTIHKGTFPSLARLEHTEIRCFGPHSTSGIYVPPVPGLEPTPVTANLGGRLRTSDRHGPHLDLLPENINPDMRQDFQFEFPVFFPNWFYCTSARGTVIRVWPILPTSSGPSQWTGPCGKARTISGRRRA